MRVFNYLIFWGSVSLLAIQCASIGQPDGGERDTTPPAMDSSASTPNLQRNFHPDQNKTVILLKFDEWIKLEEAFKQVVISPPLQYTPKIELKGKGVQVSLDPREVLLPQTTYTINFGTAIKDITENNAVKDLRFVFSTGDIIDTAWIAGKAVAALDGETKENILVMLYKQDEDSIVYKKRPTYFSRTNKEGNFIIQNIKDSTYKIVVLEDANSNYLYDQDKELIGFQDRRIVAGEDSNALVIRYYPAFVRPRITSYATESAGIVKIQANTPLEDLKLRSLQNEITLYPMIFRDTLLVYYTPTGARDWSLEINYETKILDTIVVNKIRRTTVDTIRPLELGRDIKTLGANQSFELQFNQPLLAVDTSRMMFTNDTTHQTIAVNYLLNEYKNQLSIVCPCLEKNTYTLTILPNGIKSFNEGLLADTLVIKLRGGIAEQSGSLTIDILGLDSSKHYIVRLMEDQRVIQNNTWSQITTIHTTYNFLPPSNYSIQIVEDNNNNGRWDSGAYLQHRQPEKIMTQKNYSVRANWELKEQINWKP